VTFLSVLKLVQYPGRIVGGRILFEGEDLVQKSERQMIELRGRKISMIFQDPLTALNPALTIGEQISETILTHRRKGRRAHPTLLQQLPSLPNPMDRARTRKEIREKSVEMLELVRIPSASQRLHEYPHQFSGGMRQRVVIAIALACEPSILIADEPTTALDVTIQAQILDLLNDIKEKLRMSLVLITHNFGVAREMCDRVAVMYAGNVVELSRANSLFRAPKHPYTQALMECVPESSERKVQPIPGNVANLLDLPEGCRFHPRCRQVMDLCREERPLLKVIDDESAVRCHLYGC
jgi:peptide/nickel transport system ATP-binding protein